MAFLYDQIILAATLSDLIDSIIAKLVIAGWVDDTGQKCHTAADTAGRRCYVRFTIVNDAGTDYIYVQTANDAVFTVPQNGYMYIKSTHALSVNIYCNEYWCYIWASVNDVPCAYPTAFGLFELKEDASIVGEPRADFNANPADAAGGANVAVAFNTAARWLFYSGASSEVGGCFGWLRGASASGENDATLPRRKRGIAAFLENAIKWIGTLFYSAMIPDPAITDFAYGIKRNTNPTESFMALPNANKNNDNLLVRME